jgi:non-ribosomal peptide synthetase component F
VTVSGRPPELLGVEQAIGLFINTVPARVSLAHETSGLEWLQDLQSEQRKREQFGYGKLMDLQAFTEVPAGTPLFESLLVFENYPISLEEALAGTES